MTRTDAEGHWIEERQEIAIHHEEVFACLTTAAGLTRWLPVAAEIDLRPGGLIKLGWDEHFRASSTVAILDYNPAGEMIWDWHASYEDTHAPVYWRVEPMVERGSRVHFRQGPFRDDKASLVAMADEAWFWAWHLCNLRSVLEAKLDMRSVRPL